jgi:hypothetical protein
MKRTAFWIFLCLAVPLLVGCEGCQQRAQENPEQQQNAPLEAYSTEPAQAYPADINSAFGTIKPGHWTTAEQAIRSNKADMRGELTARAEVAVKSGDGTTTGEVQSLPTVRPVVLPKGQMRRFDFRFRCPVPNSIETRRVNLSSQLVPRSGGPFPIAAQPLVAMTGSEFHFVILTTRPERFTRLQVADWVQSSARNLDTEGGGVARHYRIVIPDASDLLPLPETMLDLTSTAVILWDDLSEDALTPMQQTAIADWLRFGGRFIINGPTASESVANTMLADLLPLMPTSNIELDSQAASDLLKNWSVETDRSLEKQIEFVKSVSSRIAIDGQLDSEASAIERTASLVLQRRVGRGQIIQPRFDLTDSWIEAWDSYDSFLNGVILNRPPREYVAPVGYEDDETGFREEELRQFFADTRSPSDAAINTRVRIASRDALLETSPPRDNSDVPRVSSSPFDPLTSVDAVTGVAAWTDTSDAIRLMRDSLSSEAGIEIPGSAMVVRSLALYLLLLVPVNYLVFRLMNRLEYAWLAVPVIATVGAIWAARQAQLDIGFARSNTELSILEAHADYPRGHLTRLVGIYNSLSSRYTVQFAGVDGAALPLSNEPDSDSSIEPAFNVAFDEGPSLSDLAVPSNRLRYVHAEQIVDMGGAVRLRETAGQPAQLSNESDIDFLDAVVVRKSDEGVVETALIGNVQPGQAVTIDFQSTNRVMVSSELPMQLDLMMERFADPNTLPPGAIRFVARIDGTLDGMSITPKAGQRRGQTLALIHLRHGTVLAPEADRNLVTDFRRVNRGNEESSEPR